ncbi:MAG: sigma-70 family RNA polymerase sigma factor [Moraxellaceae bacterium]|nr:sigma-70 family RNA polymerase sigma factor [Moraxellaceae bacterium]MDZ4385672.1 sigma-70 family RNA polymerase sigma factor [Moraxellaceae bacterium]
MFSQDQESSAEPFTEEQKLWHEWSLTQAPAVRTKLFFYYCQWSRTLAGFLFSRYPHPLADWNDYVSFASLGLLQAIDRFDPKRMVKFKTYAESLIKGAVLKGLSCYVKDRERVTRDRLQGLSSEDRFRDEDNDLEQVVNAAVDLAFGYFLELGVLNEQPDDNGPLDIYEQENIVTTLDSLVAQLPERERQVIIGHYYQHLSFAELSQLMGVSRPRVSQLHAAALKRIRASYRSVHDLDDYF